MKSKVISIETAVNMVKDGHSVVVGGFAGCLHPEAITSALEERFLREGHPRDLSLIFVAGQGDHKDRGLNHFGHRGMVKRGIGGHWGQAPKLGKLAMDGDIEAYNLPMGVISHMFRDIAAGKPATFTRVGLKTFVDPRLEGGKINSNTKEDLVEVITLFGKEYLAYRHFDIDVCIIRGTTADEFGNMSMEQEVATLETLSLAMATKQRGGIVIAQVMRLAKHSGINYHKVQVPGILIDHIVVVDMKKTPHLHMQTFDEQYNPYFAGTVMYPEDSMFQPLKMDIRKIIGRRAIFELLPLGQSVVNLGIGMPEAVTGVAKEEGIRDQMTMTVESGPIGGLPASGLNFGASFSPYCVLDQPYQFDFYDGGGLDITYLGAAEVDARGDVNVSKFGPKFAGCGGFINITQNTRRIVFCTAFTACGLEVEAKDGTLKILKEGTVNKFIDKVEQITFSAEYAAEHGFSVLYITERCVFKLEKDGLHLTEIAPGIDVEKDILAHMAFKPHISENLKEMDPRIFKPEKMGVKA